MSWPAPGIGLTWRHIYNQARIELLNYAHQKQYALAGELTLTIRDGRLVAQAPARRYARSPYLIPTPPDPDPGPACQGHEDPDLWWSTDPYRIAAAQRICRDQCPIRDQCLSDAFTRRERAGVHGGELFPLTPAPRAAIPA